jgi:signal transduction histidine kinase
MSAALAPLPTTVTMMIPLLLAGYGVGAYPRGIRPRLAGLAVLVAGVLLIVAASPPQARDLAGLAPTLLWAALGTAAGWAVADRTGRVRRHRELLAELAAGRDAELRLAVAERRRSAARELHDTGASALTVVCLHAQAARASNDPARRVAALGTIASAVRAGLAELRAHLDGEGTAPLDLHEVVRAACAGGMPIELEVVGDLDALDEPRRDALARVAREALTNCARHAPGAAVVVRVACTAQLATIEVTDAGAAAPGTGDVLGAGRGLAGLAERLAALGGTLETAAREPNGFRVRATLPRAEGATR